ncbi:MAG: DUF4329 domain-containing protein [Proteobacteria bacterium]|nr:DUF4329 domain-containing protein [Pseudomonadota bacterium]
MLPLRRVALCLMILHSLPVAIASESPNLFDGPAYVTELSAVKAAADLYNPLSIAQDREYMGAIFRHLGYFYFNYSTGEVGDDAVSIRVPKHLWNEVVAFWHTHGKADFYHRYFSEVDTALVENLGLPFYLADYTGKLKVFRPGDATLSKAQAVRLGLPAESGMARGKQVNDSNNRPVIVKTTISKSIRKD